MTLIPSLCYGKTMVINKISNFDSVWVTHTMFLVVKGWSCHIDKSSFMESLPLYLCASQLMWLTEVKRYAYQDEKNLYQPAITGSKICFLVVATLLLFLWAPHISWTLVTDFSLAIYFLILYIPVLSTISSAII